MSKETFQKKLKYGDDYCEKHDYVTTYSTSDNELVFQIKYGCEECKMDLLGEKQQAELDRYTTFDEQWEKDHKHDSTT